MTDKNQVLSYWQKFFADLLIGTFVNLFLFGVIGFVVGMIGLYSLKEIYIWEIIKMALFTTTPIRMIKPNMVNTSSG